MNYRVLHLSIALLTLASSLHASDGQKKPQKKRTFAQVAQATQQPGLAGILPLSEAVENAKEAIVAGPANSSPNGEPAVGCASILQATQEMLARAAAFVAKQEDAPARSEGLEPADSLTLLVIYDPKKTKGGERFELVPADTFTPFQYRVNIPTSRKKNAATDQAFATERERTRAIKQRLEDGLLFSGAITTAQRVIVTANNGVNQRPRNTTLQQARKAGAALVAARKNNLSTVVYGPEFLNDRKELVRIDEGRKKK